MNWRENRTGLQNIALEIEKSIIIQTKGRMAGASTTQFMNQKLQEETPIFSKVFHLSMTMIMVLFGLKLHCHI